MIKDVVVKEVDLAVLDTAKSLDGKEAQRVADTIERKDTDVRRDKGKFWNICVVGTRKKLCEKKGWSPKTMEDYGAFARECPDQSGLSYPHWSRVRKAGIPAEDRPAFLEAAAKKEWTPKQVTEHAKKFTSKPKPKPRTRTKRIPSKPKTMPVITAFEEFGINIGTGSPTLTKETFNVLHRYYAKKYHPDSGTGDVDKMTKLNEAKKVIEDGGYVK